MQASDDQAALTLLLDRAPSGVNLSRFAAVRNLTSREAAHLFTSLLMKIVETQNGRLGFSRAHWDKLKMTALETVAASHRRAANVIALSEDQLFGASGTGPAREAVNAIAAELVREGNLVREGSGLRLPTHVPAMDAADSALWKKVAPLLDQSPLRPPVVHEIAAAISEDPKKIEAFLARAARFGLVVRLAQNRFFQPGAVRQLSKITEEIVAERGNHAVTAAAFRDRTGIGRTLAIEILEYFDRIKFTRRVGDAHEIIHPASEVLRDS